VSLDPSDARGVSAADDFDVELRRTVDRLRSMPVSRLGQAHGPARAAIESLAGEPVPVIADHALGDQLQVVADEAARARDFDRDAAAGLLVALRRALP
jgi:plasmid stabilization system protein ParE